jgi:hypothetical protein
MISPTECKTNINCYIPETPKQPKPTQKSKEAPIFSNPTPNQIEIISKPSRKYTESETEPTGITIKSDFDPIQNLLKNDNLDLTGRNKHTTKEEIDETELFFEN